MNLAEKLEEISIGKSALIGVVLAGLYYVLFFDTGARQEAVIRKLKTDIKVAKQEETVIDKAVEDAKRLEVFEAELGGTLDKILRYLPSDFNDTEMMQILSKAAADTGASIDNVKPKRSKFSSDSAEFLRTISVDVSLTGSFSQLMLFLANLTHVEKIITIDDMKLVSRKNKNDANLLQFTGSFMGHKFVPAGGTQ